MRDAPAPHRYQAHPVAGGLRRDERLALSPAEETREHLADGVAPCGRASDLHVAARAGAGGLIAGDEVRERVLPAVSGFGRRGVRCEQGIARCE
jgi:hypothetical protein